MSADRELTRIVRSWLQTDEHESADRVLDVVFGRLDTTPQRRPFASAWREFLVNNTVKFATAGTFAVVVAVIAFALYFSRPTVPPAASPSAEPSTRTLPTPTSPSSTPATSTRISVPQFAKPFSFVLPAGSDVSVRRERPGEVTLFSPSHARTLDWTSTSPLYRNIGPVNEPGNGIIVATTTGFHVDKCPWAGLGSTRELMANDDVLEVLRDYAGYTLTASPTMLGGRPANVISDISAACGERLGGGGIELTAPHAFVDLVPFDDTSVIIQAWAVSQDEADRWLPVAQQIVDSIEFAPDPTGGNRETTSDFMAEFSYVAPTLDNLAEITDAPELMFGYEDAPQWNHESQYGVVVAALATAQIHQCPGRSRADIRTSPQDLLRDMQQFGGIMFTEPIEGTFEGRPALFAQRAPDAQPCVGSDVHIGGPCVGGCFVPLYPNGSAILLEVDGTTVLIYTWAQTAAELETWRPIAEEFVYSIHFTSPP